MFSALMGRSFVALLFILVSLCGMPLAFSEDISVELRESLSMNADEPEKAPSQTEEEEDDEKSRTDDLAEDTPMDAVDSESEEQEEKMMMMMSDLAPLKQIMHGVAPSEVLCKESMELIFKVSGEPACVRASSVDELTQRGWAAGFG